MHRLFWFFGVAACLHGVPDNLPETKPPPVPVVPRERPITTRAIGPLEIDAPPMDEPSRQLRNEADQRDAGRRIHFDDLAEDFALLRDLAAFYPGHDRGVSEVRTVAGLANQLRDILDRLGVCVVPAGVPGIERSCAFGAALPPPRAGPAFELAEPRPGTVHLTVRDFNATWSGFADARQRLRHATGIVLDLREARGDDPLALVPWLEDVTGRAPLAPLRAITRPETADRFVAAYASRFIGHTRNRDVWTTLVGTMPAANGHPAPPPIAILLGDRCESACELVTRVLETYAGAIAYGHVRRVGRLAHDEAARLVLPNSKLSIYFFATSYALAPEIEDATGPTDAWHERHAQPFGIDDVLEFADRDVAQRRIGPWPQCTEMPYVIDPVLLWPALRAKIPNAEKWAHGCPSHLVNVTIHARAPAELVLETLNSCGLGMFHFGGGNAPGTFVIDTSRTFPFGVLAQLAAHPLVDSVELECPPEVELL